MDHIEIDFPAEPFHSVPRLLLRSLALFGSNFHFIAGVTLLVFLPATLALQLAYSMLNVATEGILSYFLMSAGDLVFAALAVPAIIYGLTCKLRSGKFPPLAESLRWGRRQWARTLWFTFKMEISILLATLLLIIPGIIRAIDLIFTETVIAIEGDRTRDVWAHSRSLAHGKRWRIFWVMLPLSILGEVGGMLVLRAVSGAASSHLLLAIADSLLAVVGQLSTVAALLLYLGVIEPKPLPAVPPKRIARDRRAR